jgi:aspartyl-tRNA(Asn)/glutamyl-tRNA(Gln) amidotransferase subunit C
MVAKKLTAEDIKHIAKLANLTLTEAQITKLATQLTSVIDFMSKIQSLDTKNIAETSQVTGLENVFRKDKVEQSRMLTQEAALSNAKTTHHGYFVAKAVLEE